MKQTAVEWLENEIVCQQNIYIDLAKKNKSLKKQVDAILTATTLLKLKCEQAKEIEKQQQGYSEEEVLEFSEWVSHNDWVYLPSKGYWINEEQEELEQKFTTKQLFKQFKTK